MDQILPVLVTILLASFVLYHWTRDHRQDALPKPDIRLEPPLPMPRSTLNRISHEAVWWVACIDRREPCGYAVPGACNDPIPLFTFRATSIFFDPNTEEICLRDTFYPEQAALLRLQLGDQFDHPDTGFQVSLMVTESLQAAEEYIASLDVPLARPYPPPHRS